MDSRLKIEGFYSELENLRHYNAIMVSGAGLLFVIGGMSIATANLFSFLSAACVFSAMHLLHQWCT
jgi:hypothetical protein